MCRPVVLVLASASEIEEPRRAQRPIQSPPPYPRGTEFRRNCAAVSRAAIIALQHHLGDCRFTTP
jgi:hypothetical protein